MRATFLLLVCSSCAGGRRVSNKMAPDSAAEDAHQSLITLLFAMAPAAAKRHQHLVSRILPHDINRRLSSMMNELKDPALMKVAELKAELIERGVDWKGRAYDKEGMENLLLDARQSPPAPSPSPPSSSPRRSATAPSQASESDIRAEVEKMKVKDMKAELQSMRIDTVGLFEKSEFAETLVKARLGGAQKATPDNDDSDVIVGETKKMNKKGPGDGMGANPFGGMGGNPFGGPPPGGNPFGGVGGNPFGGGGDPFGGVAGTPFGGMGGNPFGGPPPGGNPFGGVGGNPFGGMGGMGGMGDMMQKMMSDPKAMALMQKAQSSPKLMKALTELQQNPGAMGKYASDPEVREFLEEVRKVMGI